MLAHDRTSPSEHEPTPNAPTVASKATVVIEAVDAVDQDATAQLPVPPRTRRTNSTARPLSRVDSRIVNETTWMLAALDVMDDSPLAPATIPEADDQPKDVMIVGGDATSKMVAMRVAPPQRKHRHWASGAIILTLIVATLITAVATATPLGTGQAAGVAVRHVGPLGLPVALDAVNRDPSSQWVAVIGVQPNTDLGGGAGPGVKAPGSAGLPVASVVVTVNTGAPASSQAGYISPAPVSPWPPAYAFMAVPGYGSFGMTDVNGYYSWVFGQCTWWAQYERKDENLMHMGNAMYWASGARARGYQVGWQAQSGATVVFQPGVEGAGGAGHVAHVVKVYPGGWFLISEMNFYWNGGGWGRVDYRFAHEGSGVQFIY